MRKKNLLTTIIAAIMAVVMINAASGCGKISGQAVASATSSQSTSKADFSTTQKNKANPKEGNAPSPTVTGQSQ